VNFRLTNWLKKELERMKFIGIIRKSYSLYTLSITIMKVKKSDRITKIRLYSDMIDLNKIIIKNTKHIFH